MAALSAAASLVFPVDTATDSGIPPRSDRTWIFEPGLPRSTRLGPVSSPLFGPHRCRVGHRAAPVDPALAAQVVQDRAKQSRP